MVPASLGSQRLIWLRQSPYAGRDRCFGQDQRQSCDRRTTTTPLRQPALTNPQPAASKVPRKIQEAVPEKLERALPESIHPTGYVTSLQTFTGELRCLQRQEALSGVPANPKQIVCFW